MAGLLAGIKAGVKLSKSEGPTPRSTPSSTRSPTPTSSTVPRAPNQGIGSLFYGVNDSRKNVAHMASKKMKQLQWDKVSKTQLQKTIWSAPENPTVEETFVQRFKAADLWSEMEDEFKAREIVYDAVKKKKEAELLSVLSPDLRKRIEILMAGSTAKSFKDPERLSEAIANFNAELCTETFLHELLGVLPNDDDRGKLLTHSADSEAELELLHPADRLMVRLIQLPHLADRVKGMLFQVRFQQNVELLQRSLDLLIEACRDLRGAKKFQTLLNVILTMGNYLNGTNFAGGAYGFKIGSINKLVDTKSSNGQNLLHFLERTVSQHFPELEGFVEELAKPSEANRVNFADMQATSRSMLEEIRNIRKSLENNFQSANDGYTRKMFRFSAAAEEDLQALRDGIVNAESSLRDVETYYGEGEEHGRPVQSQDFFGVFRTFTSSYKFCRQQNRAKAEEIALRERRAAARAALSPQPTGASTSSDTNLIDARLQRLKLEGTPRIKRERRQPAPPLSPLPVTTDFSDFMLPSVDSQNVDFGSLAQKMMLNIFESPASAGGGSKSDSPSPMESPTRSQFTATPEVPTLLADDALLEQPEAELRAEVVDSRRDSIASSRSGSRRESMASSRRESMASSRQSLHSRTSSARESTLSHLSNRESIHSHTRTHSTRSHRSHPSQASSDFSLSHSTDIFLSHSTISTPNDVPDEADEDDQHDHDVPMVIPHLEVEAPSFDDADEDEDDDEFQLPEGAEIIYHSDHDEDEAGDDTIVLHTLHAESLLL